MRVGPRIAIAIGCCGVFGLSLGLGLSRTQSAIEHRLVTADGSAAAVRTGRQFNDQLGHWLVLSDLVIGAGETYVYDGAISQAASLERTLDDLEGEATPSRLATLRAFIEGNRARLDAAYDLTGPDRPRRLGELVTELDTASMIALDTVDAMQAELVEGEQGAVEGLQSARARAMILKMSACLAYLSMVIGIWWWVVRSVGRPIVALANEAEDALAEDRRLRPTERGDAEIRQLARSLAAFAGTLEDRVESRTRELQRTNEDLGVARDLAEEAARAKSDFLAHMSHEIRTPMTAIIGFSEVFRELDDEQQEEAIATIRRNGSHLLAVINDILDVSKIDAKAMTVEMVRTDLVEILLDVEAMFAMRARNKGVQLEVRVGEGVPQWIESDPIRLRQIIINLTGNALKFTERGSVTVDVTASSDDQGEGHLLLAVRDSGIGMSDEQLGRLFQPFEQGDRSMNRRFGGTGLGLKIAHGLSELMGGGIDVSSELDEGTTFVVRLPLVSVADESGPAVEAMTRSRAQRATESDGAVGDAVAVMDAPASAAESDADDMPLVAPIPEARATARILLVEDGPDNRRLLAFHLRALGADVTMAEDGAQGITAIDTEGPFDIVLMDMQMPVMDGYEATRTLRRRGDRTPIVALTAHAMPQHRAECLAAGCDDYVTKPVCRGTLQEVIDRWSRGSREGRDAA